MEPTMSKPPTRTNRDERREAGAAVAEAKRAGRQAAKLAKTLSSDARSKFEAVTASAQADVREARNELDANPGRAKRRARRAATRLEKAAVRATPARPQARKSLAKVDAKSKSKAKAEAKASAKTIRRGRVQSKQARGMAKSSALRTILASVMTPTDAERRKKDAKRLRRRVTQAA
jgi:hypothetical protein